MQNAVSNGTKQVKDRCIENGASGHEKNEDRSDCRHKKPTLHRPKRDSTNHRRPLWVVVLFQKKHPCHNRHNHRDKCRRLQHDSRHKPNHEENCIVCLEVVNVGHEPRTCMARRWYRQRYEKVAPGLCVRQQPACSLLDWLHRSGHCSRCCTFKSTSNQTLCDRNFTACHSSCYSCSTNCRCNTTQSTTTIKCLCTFRFCLHCPSNRRWRR
mmetsp:Transcript_46350/g.91894  ORF Transcript_46350/g.91894 Transcript_46350/m.91894 type:complete len:211 (+) Transcript_46350:341-973(+)